MAEWQWAGRVEDGWETVGVVHLANPRAALGIEAGMRVDVDGEEAAW